MKLIFVSLSLLLVCSMQAQTIDTDQSKVTFEISNMKWRTVQGSLNGMSGSITYDQDNLDICNFDVCVDASSIDTDNSKRDEHLLTEDFFATEQYNTICFNSSMTKKTQINGKFAVIGQLTMRGVTNDAMISFTFDGTKFSGEMKVDRLDYQVGSEVSEFLVGDEVVINIVCYVN